MDRRGKTITAVVVLVALFSVGTAYAQWWTPYHSVNLRCTYGLYNATNVTICSNGTLLFYENGWIRTSDNGNINMNPGGTGWVYIWANTNVTGHNITNVDYINPEGTDLNIGGNMDVGGNLGVGGDIDVSGSINISGELNVSGNLNMSCHNITNIDAFTNGCYGSIDVICSNFTIQENHSLCFDGAACNNRDTFNGTCINRYGPTATLEVC